MLILLAASESKAEVEGGEPFDPSDLSFPALGSTREVVLESVIEVSARPDALRWLDLRPSVEHLARRNVDLRDAPAAAAGSVYAGAVYRAIGLDDLDPSASRRAREWVVAISPLWGAVRLGDRIPAYRVRMCARPPGLGHLPQVWQAPLAEVLPAAAGRGLIVDTRQAEYLTAWRPKGELAERTVAIKAVRDLREGRGAQSHDAMRTQGQVVRRVLTEAIDPQEPEGLRDALAPYFELDLRPPERDGARWTLLVVPNPK
jgi:cytoplasmic iron level regulating protein YaaA (DUF328/UPF0246 family)